MKIESRNYLPHNVGKLSLTALAGMALGFGMNLHAADGTWLGGSGIWENETLWSSDPLLPGSVGTTDNTDTASFADTGDGTVTIDANRNLRNLDFLADGSAYTFDGGLLRLTSGGAVSVASGGGDVSFANNIELLGDYSFLNSSSDRVLSFSGDVSGSNVRLTLGGGSSTPNVMSGSWDFGTGGITVAPDSYWLLSGVGTYTGTTVIGTSTAGTSAFLHITNSAALGDSNHIRINGGGGDRQNRLILSNDVTINMDVDARESRDVRHQYAGWQPFNPHIENRSGDNTINGDITLSQPGGQGYIFLSEAGTLTFNGDIAHSRSDTRIAGFYGAGDFVVNGDIGSSSTGNVNLLATGSGTLRLSGDSKSYTGWTSVTGGALLIDTELGSVAATNNRLSVGTAGDLAQGSTATLGGTGTFSSAHADGVIIGEAFDRGGDSLGATSGIITGGDIGTIGTLTLQSNVSFVGADGALALYHVDMNDVTSDLLMIDGNLDLTSPFSGITFNVDSMTGTGAAFYELINVSGDIFGEFAHVFNLPDGYMLQYGANSIGVAIPEPSTYAAIFGFLAFAGCVIRRRFNRRAVS